MKEEKGNNFCIEWWIWFFNIFTVLFFPSKFNFWKPSFEFCLSFSKDLT